MRNFADRPLWQQVFEGCQEYIVADPAATSLSSSSSGACPPAMPPSTTSSGSPGPIPLQCGGMGPRRSVLASSASPLATPVPPTALPEPSPAPPLPPIVPLSGEHCGSFAASPPPLPPPSEDLQVSLTNQSPQSFVQWLQALSPGQLAEATASYDAFRQAQDQWMASRPRGATLPGIQRQLHRRFTVHFRMATGVAYNKWLDGPGRTSRAPLKDRSVRTTIGSVCLGLCEGVLIGAHRQARIPTSSCGKSLL